jgi:hypothetical protein
VLAGVAVAVLVSCGIPAAWGVAWAVVAAVGAAAVVACGEAAADGVTATCAWLVGTGEDITPKSETT